MKWSVRETSDRASDRSCIMLSASGGALYLLFQAGRNPRDGFEIGKGCGSDSFFRTIIKERIKREMKRRNAIEKHHAGRGD